MTIDDEAVEEETEAFTVTLSAPVNATLDTATATGTILDDDRLAAIARLQRVNEALLSRVGSALMRRNLDRVTRCIDAAMSGAADTGLSGLTGALAGYAAAQDAGAELSGWEALGGTRLAVSTDGEPSGRGALTLCAGGDWRRLTDDGAVTWEGDLVGAHVSGNVRLEGGLVAGIGVSHDRGDFDWRDNADAVSGDWRLRLTGVRPYLAWLSVDDTRLWAMAGYGSGTVTIAERTGTGVRQSARADQASAAFGGSLPLKRVSEAVRGLSARLRVEGWLGKFEVADNGDLIAGVLVRTKGVRGLLEGEWRHVLGDGIGLTPLIRVGLHHDDGAGGMGLEGSAGLRWEDRSRGLSGLLESRALVVAGEVREWGVGADVRLGRGDGLGPTLRSSVSRGALLDGTAALWERGLEPGTGRVGLESGLSGLSAARRLSVDTEAGWGLRAAKGRGLLTPFTGWAVSEGGAQSLRLGARLSVEERFRLELVGLRREGAVAPAEHGLFLRGILSL